METSPFWARILQTAIFACLVTPLIWANQLQGLDDDMEIGSDDIKNYFDDETDSFLQRTLLQRRRLKGLKTWTRRASKRIHDLNEYTKFRSDYLSHIMRVRVPGTAGHEHVKNFLKNSLEKFGWTVELDEFRTDTPVGERTFTNIMGILHPKADRRLALVAHYDSKDPKGMDLGEGEYFMGATDSAVPCAMLLDFAQMLGKRAEKRSVGGDVIVSPMIIFLDGEEAFKQWSDGDSLYGSRHLAKELDSRPHPNKLLASKDLSVLDSLDAFVLFDLIGAKNPQPQFFELYPSTHQLYKHLQDIEDKMKTNMVGTKYPYFPGPPSGDLEVEDDHKPFLLRGVPILHLVSIPFPDVWHKLGDNESALDEDTIVNLLHIFRQWLTEHFDRNNS